MGNIRTINIRTLRKATLIDHHHLSQNVGYSLEFITLRRQIYKRNYYIDNLSLSQTEINVIARY